VLLQAARRAVGGELQAFAAGTQMQAAFAASQPSRIYANWRGVKIERAAKTRKRQRCFTVPGK